MKTYALVLFLALAAQVVLPGCSAYRFTGDYHQQVQDGYHQVDREFDGYCDLRQDPATSYDPVFYRTITGDIHSFTVLSRTFPKDSLTVKTWGRLQSIVDRTDSVDIKGFASPTFFTLIKATFDDAIISAAQGEDYKSTGRSQ